MMDNILYKFCFPRELVTDQGEKFTSKLIKDIMTHHYVEHRKSISCHPQENRKVEVTNKSLENILTKVISNNKKDWQDKLIESTWAYNTTWNTTTGFAPFELVYRKKASLSI